MLVEYSVTVHTTGPAGQASGRGSLAVDGEARRTSLIEWISFVFADEAPATTEVSLVFTRVPEGSGVFRLTNHQAGDAACPQTGSCDIVVGQIGPAG